MTISKTRIYTCPRQGRFLPPPSLGKRAARRPTHRARTPSGKCRPHSERDGMYLFAVRVRLFHRVDERAVHPSKVDLSTGEQHPLAPHTREAKGLPKEPSRDQSSLPPQRHLQGVGDRESFLRLIAHGAHARGSNESAPRPLSAENRRRGRRPRNPSCVQTRGTPHQVRPERREEVVTGLHPAFLLR